MSKGRVYVCGGSGSMSKFSELIDDVPVKPLSEVLLKAKVLAYGLRSNEGGRKVGTKRSDPDWCTDRH